MSTEIRQVASSIESDPRKYMTLLHGIAGVGKTTWAKQIAGHYFLQTEIGTEGVTAFGHPVFDWQEFLTSCANMVKQQDSGWDGVREIKTIVIDRFELLYDYCGTYLCETTTFPEQGIQHKFQRIEDVPWGKGYKRTNKEIIAKLNKLMLRGFGIVLICQTNERMVKWKGQDMQKHEPNLPPAACKEIVATCGAVGHFILDQTTEKDSEGKVQIKEEKRWSFWQPTFLRVAKHRLAGFPVQLALNRTTMYDDYLAVFDKTLKVLQDEDDNEEGGGLPIITPRT